MILYSEQATWLSICVDSPHLQVNKCRWFTYHAENPSRDGNSLNMARLCHFYCQTDCFVSGNKSIKTFRISAIPFRIPFSSKNRRFRGISSAPLKIGDYIKKMLRMYLSNMTASTVPNDGQEELGVEKYANVERIKFRSFECARPGALLTNMV